MVVESFGQKQNKFDGSQSSVFFKLQDLANNFQVEHLTNQIPFTVVYFFLHQ